MKNQYITDIMDYGKYSLLRAFANSGITIGINWYLTENDGSSDGKSTQYLNQADKMRKYDPVVFDILKIINEKEQKAIKDIQQSEVLPGASFYEMMLSPTGKPKERAKWRKQWFEASVDVLKKADLIFMDPDNGLLESGDAGKLHAEKYVLLEEVERYFKDGHNVVYYCHKGRRSLWDWIDYISLMFTRIPEAIPTVLTFQKGSRSSYIFLIHKESYIKYRKIVEQIKSNWWNVFIEEYTNKGDVAGTAMGEPFIVTKTDGTTVTIQNRIDGKIEIRSSKNKNSYMVLTAEDLCRQLGV